MDLMAVTETSPLYMEVVKRILRELRIDQQTSLEGFNYARFKHLLSLENLTMSQSAPLKQRMDTLESFMVKSHAQASFTPKKSKKTAGKGNDWTPKVSLDRLCTPPGPPLSRSKLYTTLDPSQNLPHKPTYLPCGC